MTTSALKLLATASLCGTILSLGIALVIHGTTLLQLRYALQVSMSDVSLIFPAFAVGNIIGTIPAGVMPFKGRARSLAAFVVAIMGAAMMGLIPWSGYMGFLLAAFGVLGFAYGYLDTDLTTVVMDIWNDDCPPYLLALRSSSSIGSFIGGFICVPFVEQILPPSVPVKPLPTNSSMQVNLTNHTKIWGLDKLETIYMIGMCIIAVAAVFMLLMLLLERKPKSAEEEPLLATDSQQQNGSALRPVQGSRFSHMMTILLYCIVISTTMGASSAFLNYLATFTAVYLQKSPQQGARLVSVYGGCTLFSNIVATVGVKFVRASKLAILSCILTTTGFIVLSAIPHASITIWLSTVLFGLGNIPTMCLTYVMAENYGYLTKPVAGSFAASNGVAAFISTLVIARLFGINPMVVPYFCLSCSVVGFAALIGALITNKRQLTG